MLIDCPRCGEPLPDDGDRRYTDWCMACGWTTKERAERDRENDEAFARARGQQLKVLGHIELGEE